MIQTDLDLRDADGNGCCTACRYPYRGAHCDNPRCEGNPNINPLALKAIAADRARLLYEHEERERKTALRAQGFTVAL